MSKISLRVPTNLSRSLPVGGTACGELAFEDKTIRHSEGLEARKVCFQRLRMAGTFTSPFPQSSW